jgi:UDP-glucose 4-epimerase
VDVLVTGGAGFIGAHLCRALRATPDVGRVIVLDDLSTGVASNLAGLDDIDVVVGSVLDQRLVDTLVSQCQAVAHLAAIPAVARSLDDPRATHDVNVTGTLEVLDAARVHGASVIVASSSSVYGPGAALPTSEDHATRPASPYAASKLAAESYALSYGRSFGLRVLVLRFFNVFGPLQRADHAYAAVIPAFVAAAVAGRPLLVHGDGSQTRDFTYVGDVSAILADAVARHATSELPVNLAFGSNTSLLSLIEELEAVVDRPLSREFGPARSGDVHDSRADSTRLHSLFPAVRPTPLPDGLRATVDWFQRAESRVPRADEHDAPIVPLRALR